MNYTTYNKNLAEIFAKDLQNEAGLPKFQVTNPQNNDTLVYNSGLEAFINEQTAISNTFKGLDDVIESSFETGFYEVPNNGYFAASTTNADIQNQNLTQNKQVTNANVAAGQINFYCGLNPPGGTAAPLIINPIDQVIFINATTFTGINFNIDLTSTALNPTGFVGQGTMTNAVNVTLYIGSSGSTSAPFPFTIQKEKKFVCFPEQYLVLSLRLSNQGFPNSPSIDNNTNYYSRIEYLGFKYLPAVAISTTNPTSVTFSSVDNYLYYLMNSYNSTASQTGFHMNYFKTNPVRNINSYNVKSYDPFAVKQYTMTGYNDIGISFVPDVLTGQSFIRSPVWNLMYQYDAAAEAQIIAAMPSNAYFPLFCSIKPQPLNCAFNPLNPTQNNINAPSDINNWDMGAIMSDFLFRKIYQNNFLPYIQSFFMILVNKTNNYFYSTFYDGNYSLTPITGFDLTTLQSGFRTFQFMIGDLNLINTPDPYPWNVNMAAAFQGNAFSDPVNSIRLSSSSSKIINEYLYPPILLQGVLLINNTGPVLNSIGACFFEPSINTNPNLNLPSSFLFPRNAVASNLYAYSGTAFSMRTVLQNGTVPAFSSITYAAQNAPLSNYFI